VTDTDVKTPEDVLKFWFEELTRKDWFEKNEALDKVITERFAATHLSLARGELDAWQTSPQNRLAAIIVLDQLSRNIYRSTPLAFAADWIGLQQAKFAVAAGDDLVVEADWRVFFYLPFEHSENLEDQDRSVELFSQLGDADYLDYAKRHRAVIHQFGRFPHRNSLLGRESTGAELDYLSKPGAGF
jgi:uncharacterized protein (DUF924 family)